MDLHADVESQKAVLKLVRNVNHNDCRILVVDGAAGNVNLLKHVKKLAANKLRIPFTNLRLFDERGAELLEADILSASARIRRGGTIYVSAGEESCVTSVPADLEEENVDERQGISAGCGDVIILAKESLFEAQAEKQLKWAASLRGVTLAVGLPDLHVGTSCPIGAAIATEGLIYPNLVGTDIGCGVMLVRTSLKASAAEKPRTLDRWAENVRVEGVGMVTCKVVERIEDAGLAAELNLNLDDMYLCVHSGSRGFGESILQGYTRQYGSDGIYVASEGGQAYLAAHEQACRWAQVNRTVIALRILEQLQGNWCEKVLDITHNNVVEVRTCNSSQVAGLVSSPNTTSVWVHRKGAAPTDKGPVLIPGSRGAFSYVVKPVDELPFLRSGWSLAHGAGRALARSTARASGKSKHSSSGADDFKTSRQKGADLETTSLGSRVVCDDRDLLFEERPEAYKDIACVVADLVSANLCTVVALMRPVLTYKMKSKPTAS